MMANMEKLNCLGVKIDLEANGIRGEEVKLTTDDSTISCYAVPTNEELMIALDTLSLMQRIEQRLICLKNCAPSWAA